MKKTLLSIIFISFILIITGCSEDNETHVDSNYKYDVVTLEGGDYGLPTPYLHYGRGPGGYKMALIYDSLLEYGEEGLIPWMAKEYELSDDGLSYTFTLEDNIKWHDGESLTTEDVKFSFEYFEKHPPVWNGVFIEDEPLVDSIEIISETQIKFNFSKPNATILERVGKVRIIPKHIWEDIDEPEKYDDDKALIGSGPFKLNEYSSEHGKYEFIAFEDYWGKNQVVEKIRFIPISDSIMAFENNQLDLISIGTDLLPRYEDDSDYTILEDPGFWGYRLVFNLENELLSKKELRQAIAYGIDQEDIIQKVARGAAIKGSPGYLPKDHIWYNEDIKQYDYNPKKAEELLEGNEYSFKLLIGNSNNEVRIAELMKLSLADIGIDLEVESIDGRARDSALNEGNYEILLTGHGGWGSDADNLRSRYTTIDGYNNKEINRLGQAQLLEMDVDIRKDIIFEMQELIAEEIPMIPLYNTKGYRVHRKDSFDNWVYMFDHHNPTHSKLSFLEKE